jgi:enoyl-CoA hydratase/carnithine racemase
VSETSQDPPVRVHHDGAVAVVLLNQPDRRNALTTELLETLVDELQRLDNDPAVRAVVLTGGSRTFASGADVRQLLALGSAEYLQSPRLAAWRAVMNVSTPLVAAVAGPVLGGGCELALCCDLVVAADNALLGQPEIRLGIIPGAGGTQRWARVAGRYAAAEVVLLGQTIDAWQAREFGIVHRVCPRERVVEVGTAVARTLAGYAPAAVKAARTALRAADETGLATALELERSLLASLMSTEDKAEGINACLEKRPAQFHGR